MTHLRELLTVTVQALLLLLVVWCLGAIVGVFWVGVCMVAGC